MRGCLLSALEAGCEQCESLAGHRQSHLRQSAFAESENIEERKTETPGDVLVAEAGAADAEPPADQADLKRRQLLEGRGAREAAVR